LIYLNCMMMNGSANVKKLQDVCRNFLEFKSLEARAPLEAIASLGIMQCAHKALGNVCRIKSVPSILRAPSVCLSTLT